jgi:hypothetical protein
MTWGALTRASRYATPPTLVHSLIHCAPVMAGYHTGLELHASGVLEIYRYGHAIPLDLIEGKEKGRQDMGEREKKQQNKK